MYLSSTDRVYTYFKSKYHLIRRQIKKRSEKIRRMIIFSKQKIMSRMTFFGESRVK